jgi:hypothetical protein
MDLWTRLRVDSATDGTSRMTKETVARETPASAAISRRVTNWNEETAIGQTVFIWFTVWQNEKKSGNNIKYLLPADGLEVFREATKPAEVST